MEKDKDIYKEQIELRSEEVQEVMGKVPPWILRWGVTLIFVLLIVFFIGSYYFKYPDTLTAEVVLTTTTPPVELYARSTGKLELLSVTNKQKVEVGALLAVVSNASNYADVERLNVLLSQWKSDRISTLELNASLCNRRWQLGDLQTVFSAFYKSIRDYLFYQEMNYYPKKIALKSKQDRMQYEMDFRKNKEIEIKKRQTQIFGKNSRRDSLLYAKRINTGEEYNKAMQTYQQSPLTRISNASSQKYMEIQKLQNRETLLDLEQQYKETHEQCILTLSTSADQLDAQIKNWEQTYVVKSPISGSVNLMNVWSSNQSVATGDLIFIVMPDHPGTSIGKAKLSATGAGKVKIGQVVNVRVNNYPDQEFGFMMGKVSNISEIPDKNGNYFVEITFPKGLITNYGKRLPLSKQMSGTAQIIIQDKRLLERFMQPVEKFLKGNEP
jgi:multidrug resistance efflux pump